MRTAALRLVKVSAGALERIRPRPRGIVVLIYHRVGRRSRIESDLPADLFAQQMELLTQRGGIERLDRALELLAAGAAPSVDPVVVTFDDGTADFVDVALPILERYGIPCTLYVATDFVERGVPFPHDGLPLSWQALADAAATGLVDVGSHTHTHAVMSRATTELAADELDRSRGLIGDRLGVAADHFAYPKGVSGNAAAKRAVRERFRSAALGGMRPNPYGRTDPHLLSRSAVQNSDGIRWFTKKVNGGMVVEEQLRSLLNAGRYARRRH